MNESIKLVRDFLDFIAQRMAEVEPWRSMDEAEFEMALEGMEKLVMNVCVAGKRCPLSSHWIADCARYGPGPLLISASTPCR